MHTDPKEDLEQDPKQNVAHYFSFMVEVRRLVGDPLTKSFCFIFSLPLDLQAACILGRISDALDGINRHLHAELELLTSKAIAYCQTEIIPRLPQCVWLGWGQRRAFAARSSRA